MEFFHKSVLDAFLECRTGILVTPTGTIRLTEDLTQEAVWFFTQPVLLLELRPPDEQAN